MIVREISSNTFSKSNPSTSSYPLFCSEPGQGTSRLQVAETESGMPVQSIPDRSRPCMLVGLEPSLSSPEGQEQKLLLLCVTRTQSSLLTPSHGLMIAPWVSAKSAQAFFWLSRKVWTWNPHWILLSGRKVQVVALASKVPSQVCLKSLCLCPQPWRTGAGDQPEAPHLCGLQPVEGKEGC